MTSSIVVSDYETLAQNFSENAKTVLCSAVFGAGAYAIGGRLLGAAALTPPTALATAGALMVALAACPTSANQGDIFGQPPAFSGGQCDAVYLFEWDLISNGVLMPNQGGFFRGPADTISAPYTNNTGGNGGAFRNGVPVQGGFLASYGSVGQPFSLSGGMKNLRRQDGGSDNCGNAPVVGGQVISNTTTGDTIDNSTVENNENYTTVIPVLFNAGGINNTINLSFGPIEIESLFPIRFNIDVGGIGFKFKQKPNGDLEPDFSNPDKELPDDKLQKLLKEIKACVCEPAPQLDMLMLPTVSMEAPCQFRTEELLVPRGSVSSEEYGRFLDTAALALGECERINVVQLEESAIYSATTTQDGRELFTGLINPEVVSLILRITAITESGPDLISLYPAANQRKFGSVSFVTDGVEGGGDYIYVFDVETYIPLPLRGKQGRLRLLLKRGLSFSVYDSGERI